MAGKTVKLYDKQGKVKKLAASKITRDLGRDGMWYSPSATEITTVPSTLSNSDEDCLIWERGEWIKVEFIPDSTLTDGQGFPVIPSTGEWEVASVTGTVVIVRCADIASTDSGGDIFANSNRFNASVGDKLYSSDAILCAKASSSFVLKIVCPVRIPYLAVPAVEATIPA